MLAPRQRPGAPEPLPDGGVPTRRRDPVMPLRRRLTSVGLAMLLPLAIAAPATAADGFVIPAGEGCAFDVFVSATDLPEAVGDHNPVGFGNITFTNLDTGAWYLQKSRH